MSDKCKKCKKDLGKDRTEQGFCFSCLKRVGKAEKGKRM